jgi:hypothetical protein
MSTRSARTPTSPAAVNGREPDLDIDALIDAAQPAQRSIALCLRGDLTSAYEELERRLTDAEAGDKGDSLASGSATVGILADMDALREQMKASTVTVVVKAMPRKAFRKLLDLHPPKMDDDGKVDPDDARAGFNTDTLYDPLIRACWSTPVISKERMALLLDEKLTDRQWQRLALLALQVNTDDVDIPFSYAASRLRQTSSPE